VCGLFYRGECSSEEFNRRLRKIYNKVYEKDHSFVVVKTSSPCKMYLGWKEQIYPPVEVTKEGGMIEIPMVKKKKPLNQGMAKKHTLYREAKKAGLPSWSYKVVTPLQLEQFLKMIKDGGKPDISEIINQYPDGKEKLFHKFFYNIRQYRKSRQPVHLEKISDFANRLITQNHATLGQLKVTLKQAGISDLIENFEEPE
jgi:hypothetical protein